MNKIPEYDLPQNPNALSDAKIQYPMEKDDRIDDLLERLDILAVSYQQKIIEIQELRKEIRRIKKENN